MACCIRLAMWCSTPVPPQDTADYDELALNVLRGVGYVSYEKLRLSHTLGGRRPTPSFGSDLRGVGYSHAAYCANGDWCPVCCAAIPRDAAHIDLLLGQPLWLSAHEPLVSVCSELMSECLFTFFILLALWAIRHRQRWQMLALSGVAIGLAALTRPVGLLILPALGLVALCEIEWKAWRGVAWAGLATAVVILPWTVRNAAVHGAFVPVSTHGGFIVARSNALEPAWRQERGWGIDRAVFEAMPTEVERDRFWWKQGREFILSHPLAYGRLVFERLLRFLYFFRPSYKRPLPRCCLSPYLVWRYGRRPEFRIESRL